MMDPTSPPVQGVSPSLTGPPLVGIVLGWWLHGILTMQYFTYINGSSKDRKWLQGIVHFIFLMGTVQAFMSLNDIFYCITAPFINAIIASTVQLVYGWRIWVLGQWTILPVIIVILSFVNCGIGMFLGTHCAIQNAIEAVDGALAMVWSSLAAITDIMIAVCMTYLLLKYQSEKPNRRTIAMIQRILLLTLETNALTTLNAVVSVLLFVIPSIRPGKTSLFTTFGYVIGKIYSNSFMVLLNQQTYYKVSRKTGSRDPAQFEVFTPAQVAQDNSTFISSSYLSSQGGSTGPISAIQFADPAPNEVISGAGKKNGRNAEPFTDVIAGDIP